MLLFILIEFFNNVICSVLGVVRVFVGKFFKLKVLVVKGSFLNLIFRLGWSCFMSILFI